MQPGDWVTLAGVVVSAMGLVGAIVYSHVSLKEEVRRMHRCHRASVRLIARKFTRLEKRWG